MQPRKPKNISEEVAGVVITIPNAHAAVDATKNTGDKQEVKNALTGVKGVVENQANKITQEMVAVKERNLKANKEPAPTNNTDNTSKYSGPRG